jgi:hypothetical protein
VKRRKKDLEKMLATRIVMTVRDETYIDVPLEALLHIQGFLGGKIPLDVDGGSVLASILFLAPRG